MRLTLLILAALPLLAIDGIVVNGTTGKPQPGVAVTLTQLAQGMKPVGTATSGPDGKFAFEVKIAPETPYLLQANHEGVNYNRMLPPGPPPALLSIQVFDATNIRGSARVTQDMILLEPTGSEINVSESVVWQNDGKTTYNDPAGTFRFYLPPGAGGQVSVSVVAPGGMPLNRPAEKTAWENVFAVKYPVKPGETRFDLQYRLPAQETFETKLLHGGGPIRLIAPRGVKFESEQLKELGPEPRTQATIYDVQGSEIAFKIAGTGTLRGPEPTQQSDADVPQIEEKKPRIYERLPWVLGFTAGILLFGGMILYRSRAPVERKAK